MSEAVLCERSGRVLLITLNRPEARNAVNTQLANGLWEAVERLNDDPGLTVGVLTGAGRGFCAGIDLKAFVNGEDITSMLTFLQRGAVKPLIAAIEGFALGGGLELALTCDLLVAAKGAKLGTPEVGRGLFASGGGLLRLPSRIGHARAMEMAITGDPLLAEDAAQFGLVARVTEPGGAVAAALEMAERIAANAPLAVAASKELINATQGITESEFWELQESVQKRVFSSDDAKEGARAFAEKRAPRWSGT